MRRRPFLPLLVATSVAATLAGCGGGDGGDDFARFTAQDVQKRFQEVSGFRLDTSGPLLGSTTLTLASDGPDASVAQQRYGSFQITVASDEDTLKRRQEGMSSGQVLTVDNVLLRGGYGSADDAGYRRVSTILRSLGKPLSSVHLPPEDTPCERAGIDPDGGTGRTGTCLDGVQTVTVVPADETLTLPGETVSKPVTKVARTVKTRRYGTTRTLRARGRFVTVRTRIENTSNVPFNQPDAALVINGRTYAADDQDFLLQEQGRLEYQPGERATVTFLFDIPRDAEDPRTGGALQFATTNEGIGSPERAVTVSRIRLR